MMGVERKQLVADLRASRQRIKDRLEHGDPLVPTYGKDDYWPQYNSSVRSYEETFSGVLTGNKFRDLLSERDNILVVDLMAPTGTIAELFQSLPDVPNKRGIAVSLKDKRSDCQKDRDKARGITHIEGDLINPRTWRNLRQELGGQTADLVMLNAGAGLLGFPQESGYYAYALKQIWNITNENNGNVLLKLIENLSFSNPLHIGNFEGLLAKSGITYFPDYSKNAVRIIKQPDSQLDFSPSEKLIFAAI